MVVSDHIVLAITLAVETWKNGNKKTGKNEVITIGIGSNTQYNAVHNSTPIQGEACGWSESRTMILNRKGIAMAIGIKNSSHQTTFLQFTIWKFHEN